MDLDKIAGVTPAVDEQAIDAELAHFLDPSQPPVLRSPWRITSLGAADWAMRRVQECAERAKEYQDEVELWKRAAARIANAGRWFEARLAEWAVEQRKSTNHKTFTLAHGTVGTRESQPKPVVVDEGAAVEWAITHCPDAVKTERTFLISKAAVRVVDFVVGFTAAHRGTGEVETINVTPGPLDESVLQGVRERLPEHHVDPITEPTVVDGEGRPIPGLGVSAGSVTASVKPLGL